MVFPRSKPKKKSGNASAPYRGFANLNFDHPGLTNDVLVDVVEIEKSRLEWTAASGRAMVLGKNQRLISRIRRHISRWPIDDATKDALLGMLGTGPLAYNDLASNQTLKLRVGDAGSEMIRTLSEEDPELRFYHGTIFDDKVRTTDRTTVMDLVPFQKRVRKIMAAAGINDWIGVIELEGETNSKPDVGRPIIPHAHITFWRREPLATKTESERLSRSSRLSSATGAQTVNIKSRRDAEASRYTWYYSQKPPKGVNVIPSRNKPGQVIRREARLRTNHALRIAEALSHYRLESMLMSAGGNGMRFRRQVVAAIIHYRDTPCGRHSVRHTDVAAIWLRARNVAKKVAGGPVQVIRR